MRILIAVTHLLGAGHLTRAAALARAFTAAGHEAWLVSGGAPAPMVQLDGVRMIQLPPLHVRGTAFGCLLDAQGHAVDAACLASRQQMLLAALHKAKPDVVVTELFPFGRRMLADEFLAFVEAARALHPRPLILSSVRDILIGPDRTEKVAQAHDRIGRFHDGVLVHGDPALVPLDASWPVDPGLADKLHYTGYVDEGGVLRPEARRQGVVVAAGSSAAGLGILRAAAGAALRRSDLGWRILVGHGVSAVDFAAIGEGLGDGVLDRARADYRNLLAGAAVSVSACGYNTAVDLLAAGPRAVLVPFEAGRETEQRLRAETLATRGLARVLPEAELDANTLLESVQAALAEPPPQRHGIDLRGAERCVAVVESLLLSLVRDVAQAPSAFLDRASRQQRGISSPLWGGAGGGGSAAWGSAVPSAPPPPLTPPHTGEGKRALAPIDRLHAALDDLSEQGACLSVWWRDDDAVAATPALDRLLGLAEEYNAPILIAAILAGIEHSLGRRIEAASNASLAVHGLAHANHARAGEKPAEFGPHRPLGVLVAEASEGLRIARLHLPADRLLPVFVPPWNRLSPDLAKALPNLGYLGLSAAPGPPVAGLIRADCHLDPITWHGTRSLADPERLIDGFLQTIASEPGRPLGLLTHHLAHDAALWAFVAGLVGLLSTHPAVRFLDPRHLFRAAADEDLE